MNQYVALLGVILLGAALTGCGGSPSTSSSTSNTSGLKKRVLLSNNSPAGPNVVIVDALLDKLSTFTIVVVGPTKLSTGGGFTGVISNNSTSLPVIDNTKEIVALQPVFPGPVSDIAVSSDGKTVYAAIRNSSQIEVVNTADGTFTSVSVPAPGRLVLSPNGTKLLIFADGQVNGPAGSVANVFFVMDTASKVITTVSAGVCSGPLSSPCLDQPFNGVFNGSETQAFIMNCGPECGGNAASVSRVDFSGAPVLSNNIAVCGATVGLISGSSLLVAGSSPTPPIGCPAGGTLQSINTGTLTAALPIAITDGRHTKMTSAGNNRVYIGATGCTPVNDAATGKTHGCLTIFNTSSSTVIVPEFGLTRTTFDVTGIQPIAGRTVIYVCEGGELDIFDNTTDALTANQVDVVGKAVDVVQIDP